MKQLKNLNIRNAKDFLRSYGIFLLIIALGLQLKFHSIESKYFWYDEIETIMHTSGIPDKVYDTQLPLNEVKNIGFFQDKLRLNTQGYSMHSQIMGVFSMPQLTPLHPLLLIFWSKIVGDEFVHYRLFNVFLFLLLLPFLFLLCKTLFKSNAAGWIALSLIAVSPFFDIYTKEARYVILWTFFIVMNSYFFIKAYENNKKIWWWCYSISGILLMYASLLSGLLILSQLIVVAIVFKKYYAPFFLSLLIITIAYLPWMVNIGIHIQEILQSLQWHKSAQSSSFYTPFIGQFVGFAHVFISFENVVWSYIHMFMTSGGFRFTFDLILASIIIFLILFSFLNMLKKGPPVARGIVLALVIVPLITFWLYDLMFVGRISFLWRYQVVAFVGILLVVTHFLNYMFTAKNKLFKVVFIGLSLIGIFSIYIVSLNKCYTTLGSCNGWDNFNITERISHSTRPLIITDLSFWGGVGGTLEVLSNSRSSEAQVLYTSPGTLNIKEEIPLECYSEVYIIHASKELIQDMELQFGNENIQHMGGEMWTIVHSRLESMNNHN